MSAINQDVRSSTPLRVWLAWAIAAAFTLSAVMAVMFNVLIVLIKQPLRIEDIALSVFSSIACIALSIFFIRRARRITKNPDTSLGASAIAEASGEKRQGRARVLAELIKLGSGLAFALLGSWLTYHAYGGLFLSPEPQFPFVMLGIFALFLVAFGARRVWLAVNRVRASGQ